MIHLLTLLVLTGSGKQQCGNERWAVKTCTNDTCKTVATDKVNDLTVEQARTWKMPHYNDANPRTGPELSRYKITARVLGFKLEDDEDFHVVLLGDTDDATMIAEFPSDDCIKGSQFETEIHQAKQDFLAAMPMPKHSKLQHLIYPTAITIEGLAFFDKIHGQDGVAPNGVEIHPVLKVYPITMPTDQNGKQLVDKNGKILLQKMSKSKPAPSTVPVPPAKAIPPAKVAPPSKTEAPHHDPPIQGVNEPVITPGVGGSNNSGGMRLYSDICPTGQVVTGVYDKGFTCAEPPKDYVPALVHCISDQLVCIGMVMDHRTRNVSAIVETPVQLPALKKQWAPCNIDNYPMPADLEDCKHARDNP